jgi:peroxiredoxin Q/BCP
MAYGAADDANTPMARRAAAIVDPEGRIVRWWPKVSAKDFPREALAAIPG